MTRRARALLGTFFEISLEAESQSIANAAIDAGFAEASRLERMLSFFNPESEVSRLNAFGHRQAQIVSPELLELLRFCVELSRQSGNLFDVTVSENSKSTSECIVIEGNTVGFKETAKVNLGGIAKGFIVDRVTDTLLKGEVSDIIVNAGGDLKISRSSGIPVGIRDPREPTRCAEAITIASGAVSTSAPYFSFSKLIDPRTGACVDTLRSVSVIANSCMVADGLTKVVGLEASDTFSILPILKSHGASALVLSSDTNDEKSREFYG